MIVMARRGTRAESVVFYQQSQHRLSQFVADDVYHPLGIQGRVIQGFSSLGIAQRCR